MLFPLCAAAHAATQDARAERVDALFAAWDTRETPGAVVAVIKDADFLYQQAYGMADLERDVPLSTRSIFDIASISKQFVAFSILLLKEQGKLALDDDIRTYLPELLARSPGTERGKLQRPRGKATPSCCFSDRTGEGGGPREDSPIGATRPAKGLQKRDAHRSVLQRRL